MAKKARTALKRPLAKSVGIFAPGEGELPGHEKALFGALNIDLKHLLAAEKQDIVDAILDILNQHDALTEILDRAPRAAHMIAELSPLRRTAGELVRLLDAELSEQSRDRLVAKLWHCGAETTDLGVLREHVEALVVATDRVLIDLDGENSQRPPTKPAQHETIQALGTLFDVRHQHPPSIKKTALTGWKYNFIVEALTSRGIPAPEESIRRSF